MEEIDIEVTKQLELLKKLSETFKFKEICQFSIENSNELIPYDELKITGLYLFEIKNKENENFKTWIDKFKPKFRGGEKKLFLHKFTPNIIEKRVSKIIKEDAGQNKNMTWIPFYIGKSKKISERLDKHINSTLGKPPFALKLKGRNNLNDEVFKLKVLEINVDNYDVIVTKLERIFREKFDPIVGRQ
jgi:hypothetical protein